MIKYCCLAIGAVLLFYTAYRGIHLSFTHDECGSYKYVHYSFMDIISNNTGAELSANNHLLNTLFMKLFAWLFGTSEVALRLHSILAHVVFMVYSFLLLKSLRPVVVLCGFVLLNANPYMLDFFSLARGYALASTFMLVSIYYLISFYKEGRQRSLLFCLVAGMLSVLSNFALVTYFLSVVVLYEGVLLWGVIKNKQGVGVFFRKSSVCIGVFVLTIAICYEPMRRLIEYDQLYFGGKTGFWADTVGSLVQVFLYDQGYGNMVLPVIQGFVLVVCLGAIAVVAYKRVKKKQMGGPLPVVLYVLFFIVVCSVLQHLILSSSFLMERFALFLVPIFMLTVIYLFDELIAAKVASKPLTGLMCVVTVLFIVHCGKSVNLDYTYNWRYDADIKHMLATIEQMHQKTGQDSVKLAVMWANEPAVNFYREVKGYTWLQPVTRYWRKLEFDYYYVNERYFVDYEDLKNLRAAGKQEIGRYSTSGGVLYKN